jgi:hypothetical protein
MFVWIMEAYQLHDRQAVSDHAIIFPEVIGRCFLTSNELEGLGFALIVRHLGGIEGSRGEIVRLSELNG